MLSQVFLRSWVIPLFQFKVVFLRLLGVELVGTLGRALGHEGLCGALGLIYVAMCQRIGLAGVDLVLVLRYDDLLAGAHVLLHVGVEVLFLLFSGVFFRNVVGGMLVSLGVSFDWLGGLRRGL